MLLGELMAEVGLPAVAGETDQAPDSLPIMLAVRGRSIQAKWRSIKLTKATVIPKRFGATA